MSLSINTHHYDGALKDLVKKVIEYSFDQTYEETINEIKGLVDKINYRKNDIDRVLLMIATDKSGNYDSTNDVHLEDILPRLWKIVKAWETSAHIIFLEQLADITNGTCPQGRNTRLLQLF